MTVVGELDQRKRVAGGGSVQALGGRRRQPAQKGRRLAAGQAGEPQRRQIGPVEKRRVAVADRDQDRDRVGHQPAEREQQRLRARAVEPVGIVDQDRHGALLGVRREQAEGGRPDREPLLSRAAPQRERTFERNSLWLRDPIEHRQRRPQQLEQSGERNLGLGLDPARAQDAHPGGAGSRVVEQRRLPDPRLPHQRKRRAGARARALERPLDRLALPVTTDQHHRSQTTRCHAKRNPRRLGAPRKRGL